jgi:mevalonate kinase
VLRVSGKACAKFILVGEHFIVGGDTGAVAVPLLSLHTRVELADLGTRLLRYQSLNISGESNLQVEEMMPAILQQALLAAEIQNGPQQFLVQSNFPIGKGFGSSASLSVALARALSEWAKNVSDKYLDNYLGNAQEIFFDRIVSRLEKFFHGNPSGVDAAVITAEKPIYFRRHQPVEVLGECHFDFVLLDGGQRDQCKELVHQVAVLRNEQPALWEQFEREMKIIVSEVVSSFSGSSLSSNHLAKCVDANHSILQHLSLSTPQIDEMIVTGKRFGALGGKVSGAGAGGAVLLVAEKGGAKVLAEKMKDKGYEVVSYTEPLSLNQTQTGRVL